jgi:hypothetical protein
MSFKEKIQYVELRKIEETFRKELLKAA